MRGSAATAERAESTRAEPVSRKAQRQREAQQRLLLKPLRDRVRTIEKQLENQRRKLLEIEQLMTDVTLYSDPERKEEMNSLTQQRTELKATLETLEWSWLEASEALEQASAED